MQTRRGTREEGPLKDPDQPVLSTVAEKEDPVEKCSTAVAEEKDPAIPADAPTSDPSPLVSPPSAPVPPVTSPLASNPVITEHPVPESAAPDSINEEIVLDNNNEREASFDPFVNEESGVPQEPVVISDRESSESSFEDEEEDFGDAQELPDSSSKDSETALQDYLAGDGDSIFPPADPVTSVEVPFYGFEEEEDDHELMNTGVSQENIDLAPTPEHRPASSDGTLIRTNEDLSERVFEFPNGWMELVLGDRKFKWHRDDVRCISQQEFELELSDLCPKHDLVFPEKIDDPLDRKFHRINIIGGKKELEIHALKEVHAHEGKIIPQLTAEEKDLLCYVDPRGSRWSPVHQFYHFNSTYGGTTQINARLKKKEDAMRAFKESTKHLKPGTSFVVAMKGLHARLTESPEPFRPSDFTPKDDYAQLLPFTNEDDDLTEEQLRVWYIYHPNDRGRKLSAIRLDYFNALLARGDFHKNKGTQGTQSSDASGAIKDRRKLVPLSPSRSQSFRAINKAGAPSTVPGSSFSQQFGDRSSSLNPDPFNMELSSDLDSSPLAGKTPGSRKRTGGSSLDDPPLSWSSSEKEFLEKFGSEIISMPGSHAKVAFDTLLADFRSQKRFSELPRGHGHMSNRSGVSSFGSGKAPPRPKKAPAPSQSSTTGGSSLAGKKRSASAAGFPDASDSGGSPLTKRKNARDTKDQGSQRKPECLGCLRSAIASQSDGSCYETTGKATNMCWRCSSGHSCTPIPTEILKRATAYLDDMQKSSLSPAQYNKLHHNEMSFLKSFIKNMASMDLSISNSDNKKIQGSGSKASKSSDSDDLKRYKARDEITRIFNDARDQAMDFIDSLF